MPISVLRHSLGSAPRRVIERTVVIFIPPVLRIVVSMGTQCAGMGKHSWHIGICYKVGEVSLRCHFGCGYIFMFSRNNIAHTQTTLMAWANA